MTFTWAKVRGWRLRRQLLDPVGSGSVLDVVRRLGAVPAWPDAAAERAIGARRTEGRTGDVARALSERQVVKVFAFHGATHLMTPQGAGAYLALRASSRMWELPSWQSFYRLGPSDWPSFREYVRDALAGGPLTHAELIAALGRSSRYRHLGAMLSEGHDTVLKPLTWQGDMGLGPTRDGEATFLRLDDVPGWAGIPDLDLAGPAVVETYLHTYGPATTDRIQVWLGEGLGAKRRAITRWLERLDERIEPISVEGERVLALRQDLDDLGAAPASTSVRLLPGRDPWVMAHGTSDPRVVPPSRRELISRAANPVLHRGVVAGTWRVREGRLDIGWFTDSGRVPRSALDQEAEALATFLDRRLDLAVELT